MAKEEGMSLAIDKPMQELKAVMARYAHTLDEPEAIPLVAHVRAAGLLTDAEWQDILVWLDEAMLYLADAESDDAGDDEPGAWSPDDDSDVESIDADIRNADWIRIVGARRLSEHMLPSWAGLWLWWIGHDREIEEWWGPIGELAGSLRIPRFEVGE